MLSNARDEMYLWSDPSNLAGVCYTLVSRSQLLEAYGGDASKVDDILVVNFATRLSEEQAKALLAALAVE